MRKPAYFAVFHQGKVTAIVQGHLAARRLSPHRGYKSFRNRQDAEEFASWWNYEHRHWTEKPNRTTE